MCAAAFKFCEETAKRFDATAPMGAPSGAAGSSGASAAPPEPIALAGEIVCAHCLQLLDCDASQLQNDLLRWDPNEFARAASQGQGGGRRRGR